MPEVPECLFFHNDKGLTGLDDKENCLELVESIRLHTILPNLCFLSLQLSLVFLVPRRHVLFGDVIGSHTLSGAHAYPDRWVCVRSSMLGLKLFVDVINQSESTPIR